MRQGFKIFSYLPFISLKGHSNSYARSFTILGNYHFQTWQSYSQIIQLLQIPPSFAAYERNWSTFGDASRLYDVLFQMTQYEFYVANVIYCYYGTYSYKCSDDGEEYYYKAYHQAKLFIHLNAFWRDEHKVPFLFSKKEKEKKGLKVSILIKMEGLTLSSGTNFLSSQSCCLPMELVRHQVQIKLIFSRKQNLLPPLLC